MLDLVNIINISVSQAPVGLEEFNVNNLALFTDDSPITPYFPSYKVYVSAAAVATDFGSTSETYQQAVAVFSQQPNILTGGGRLIIIPLENAESMATALTRTKDLVYYCGIISTAYPTGSDRKTLADAVQACLDKLLFLPSETYADVAGVFTDIKAASDYNTRCLLYQTSALDSRLFAAAAASKTLSVDFTGSNTTITMNLKQLATIEPDEAVDQTKYAAAATAGVDLYVSYAGVSAYVSNGANKYVDQAYNLIWFVNALKVAGFNALQQLSTKLPQTEPGVSILQGAYRGVCEAAKNNGYIAPGAWTLSEWFGSQVDMAANILQRGYYLYHLPVNLQSSADRAARKAPLIQIAVKEAGAIHSSSVIVYINQ